MGELSFPSRRGSRLVVGAAVVALATSFTATADASLSRSAGEGRTGSEHSSISVPQQATLRISGFSFGKPLTVSPGEKISIVNADNTAHTVTADRGNVFNVSVGAGASATMTAPAARGSYPFHCNIHPSMKGTLIVR